MNPHPPEQGGARSETMPREPRLKFIPVVLLLLYTLGILGHDLWASDEPRVASVARQVSEGAWVIPTLNGEPFLEQPPLHSWCVAGIYLLFGFQPPEIGRVVSAFFGIGGLVWTYLLAAALARRAADEMRARRVGLFAALSLGLSFEYLVASHKLIVDGSLTFFTTGAVYALYRGLVAERLGHRLWWLTLGYSLTSLAFMSKGMIGIAIPALGFMALGYAFRDASAFRRGHLWLAPLCFLAITGPWFYLLHQEAGADGLRAIFVENTIERVFPSSGVTPAHTRPLTHYLPQLPVILFPSTLFLIGAGIARWGERNIELDRGERQAFDFCLAWFGAGFLLLSLAATKRDIYLLPLFPAAAIASGFWLEAFVGRRVEGRYARRVGLVLAGLLGLMSVALSVAAGLIPDASISISILGTTTGLTMAISAWSRARHDRRAPLLFSAVSGFCLVALAASLALIPAVDAQKGMGSISHRVAALVPEDCPIYAFQPDEVTRAVIPFYTSRPLIPLHDLPGLEERLDGVAGVYVLAVDRGPYDPGTRDWENSRYGKMVRYPHQLLLEDLGTRSVRRRAFRLLYLESSRKVTGLPLTAGEATR